MHKRWAKVDHKMFILCYALPPKQRVDFFDQDCELVQTQSIPDYASTMFTRFKNKVDDPRALHPHGLAELEKAAKNKVEAKGELKLFTNHV